jgi:hypothetical protein
MAKAKQTSAAKKSTRPTKAPAKATRAAAEPLAQSINALADQVSEITRTLRGQQAAIEELIALHHGLRAAANGTVVADDTVGSIPRIPPLPNRAA